MRRIESGMLGFYSRIFFGVWRGCALYNFEEGVMVKAVMAKCWRCESVSIIESFNDQTNFGKTCCETAEV